MKIQGKIAIVTGGASGLGQATVRHLYKLGARVLVSDLNSERGSTLAEELGENAFFIETDVTDETSMENAIKTTLKRFGGVHILVNCAGIAIAEKIIGKENPHSLKSFNEVIRVNLVGTFNALRLSAWVMKNNEPGEEEERGVIINTASIAAFEGQIGQVAYAASKGGVVGLTLPAARELGRYGIRVVTIAPGVFDTSMVAGLPKPAIDSLTEQIPFPRRLGKSEEYALLIAHIIENTMINGGVIRLDGALRMAPR